jgi:hypothetical protein
MKVQGDLFFIRIQEIPEGSRKISPEGNCYILARGEITGHSHKVLSPYAELFEKDGALYLKVLRSVQVTHEEHRPITLEPGAWRVGIQREYSPFNEEDWIWIRD